MRPFWLSDETVFCFWDATASFRCPLLIANGNSSSVASLPEGPKADFTIGPLPNNFGCSYRVVAPGPAVHHAMSVFQARSA